MKLITNYLCVFILLITFSLSGNTQVNMQEIGQGKYSFTSFLPNTDMHFYLYDDGYHSFDNNNVHEYHTSNSSANPIVYHTSPYDIDDIEELAIAGNVIGTVSPNIVDVDMTNKVEISKSWSLVEDKENFYILMIKNDESQSPISGCVEFHYDNSSNTINPQTILDHYNGWVNYQGREASDYASYGYTDKLVWGFDDLAYQEQRYIYVPADCNLPAFSIVKNAAVMKTDCSSVPPYEEESSNGGSSGNLNDVYVLKSRVKNFPHDPNCIIPSCGSGPDEYDNSDNLALKYRIYFKTMA